MSSLSSMYEYVSPSVKYRCFSCGEITVNGGYWMGRGFDIVVCDDVKCIECLLHLALDALSDGVWKQDTKEERKRNWQVLADKVVEKKGPTL